MAVPCTQKTLPAEPPVHAEKKGWRRVRSKTREIHPVYRVYRATLEHLLRLERGASEGTKNSLSRSKAQTAWTTGEQTTRSRGDRCRRSSVNVTIANTGLPLLQNR